MVALVFVFLLEFLVEGLDRRLRRIDGQADVGNRPVGGFTGELDYLLAGQRRFADDRLVVALFF
jgi:hypothetical protein